MAVAFSGLLISSEIILNQVLGCGCSFGYFCDQNYLSSSSSWIAWWPHPNILDGVKSYDIRKISKIETIKSLKQKRIEMFSFLGYNFA